MKSQTGFESSALALLLAFSVLLAFAAILNTGTGDVAIFIDWMNTLYTQGFRHAYSVEPAREYPPLSCALLLLAKIIGFKFGVEDFLALKVLIFVFYITSVGTIYFASRNLAVTTALAWSMIVSTSVLGYIDVLFAPFLRRLLLVRCQEADMGIAVLCTGLPDQVAAYHRRAF